jgi:hypothetical protein
MDFSPNYASIRPPNIAALLPKGPSGEQPSAGRPAAFLAKAHKRRFASLKHAKDLLEHVPGEGESLHCIMTTFADLASIIAALLDRLDCVCTTLRVSTLSASKRNVCEFCQLLDQGRVESLDLLASHFWSRYEEEIFTFTREEFRSRPARLGIARSHCKITTIALADGRRYTIEGSGNTRSNRNSEQFSLARDRELFTFYDDWLQGMMALHSVAL